MGEGVPGFGTSEPQAGREMTPAELRKRAVELEREEMRTAREAEHGILDTGVSDDSRRAFEHAVRERYAHTPDRGEAPRAAMPIGQSVTRLYSETDALDEIVSKLEEKLEPVLAPEIPHLPGGERMDAPTALGEHIEQAADRVDKQTRRLMSLAVRLGL